MADEVIIPETFFIVEVKREMEPTDIIINIGKKKGRKRKSKIYFPREVENFIDEYNNEYDPVIRHAIYTEHIQYPFEKLAENMINTFKFPYIYDSYLELKSEVVSHMIINIGKYQLGKGKAFSYFSIVAKNYLIIRNNEAYKKAKITKSIDAAMDSDEYEFDIVDSSYADGLLTEEYSEFIRLVIEYWDENIPTVFRKKRDIEIAYSIIELFRNVKSLEFYNKKALYLLIRNMTDYKTQYITKVINKMSEHYGNIKRIYHSEEIMDERRKFF